MRRATILSLALFSLLSLAGAAAAAEVEQPAAAVETVATAVANTDNAVATPAASQAIKAEAQLCNLLEQTGTNVLESATAGYWCPSYSRYCQRNEQCSGYCGVGYDYWAICSQGCCACLG